MNKDKLGQAYFEIHDPKILINNSKLCDFKILKTELKNGHSIAMFEASIKCKGIVDMKLEFMPSPNKD